MDATENGIYYSIIICGLFLVLFVIVFIGSSTWLQRKFQKSQQLRLEAEVNAMERERMRMAKDLHDDIGPGIYSLLRGIENIQGHSEKELRHLHICTQQLHNLDKKIQQVTRNLAPVNLKEKGLFYCLEELFINTQMQYGIAIDYHLNDLPPMNHSAETHIFRIMQEVVFNTVKHSGASRLTVMIQEVSNGHISIQTADDGIGKTTAHKPAGHGLENIKSRAIFLGGTAEMDTTHGFKWNIQINSHSHTTGNNVPPQHA